MNIKWKIKNQKGFSLLELMVAIGIAGAISLGVAELIKNSSKQSARFSDKIELRNLIQLISLEYGKTDVCNKQFSDSDIPANNITLNSKNRVLLKPNQEVVNGHYKVTEIETVPVDKSKFELKITFADKRPGANNNKINEKILISADVDNVKKKINNCYQLGNLSLDTTDANLQACQGPGILLPHPTGSCTIKGFSPLLLENSTQGKALVNFTGAMTTGIYKATINEPIEKNKNCQPPHFIEKHTITGDIKCVDLHDYVEQPSPVNMTTGASCGVVPVGSKLKFACGAVCTCQPKSSYCANELKLDSCGNPNCPTGTKRHGCFCLNGCPSRNSYCQNEVKLSNCNSPCPTGMKLGCGVTNCFVAGTIVELLNGEQKPIEDVAVGDKLVDRYKKEVRVEKLLIRDYEGLIYSINGGEYFFTPNHPFLTLQGWKSLDPLSSNKEIANLNVSLMKEGDILVRSDGMEVIYTLDSIETKEKVYNFQLNNSHEYVANGFVVHNKHACPECPSGQINTGTGTGIFLDC